METERVIFRKFNDGDIIALFPDLVGDINNRYCLSYQHMGQHGSAAPELVYVTKLATEDEYRELKEELERIGYKLKIVKRFINPLYKTGRR